VREPARFDPYVIDTLMPDLVGHDRQPSAFIVYLYLADRVTRARARSVAVSLSTIAADTGLSKTAVQRGLRTLTRRRLLRTDKPTRTSVPHYTLLQSWGRARNR
jgi:DNA-binding GntR family transcriptional regulator